MANDDKVTRPDVLAGRPESGKNIPMEALSEIIERTTRDVFAQLTATKDGVFAQYTEKINELIRQANLLKDDVREMQTTVYGVIDEDSGFFHPGMANQLNQVNDLVTAALRMAHAANPETVTREAIAETVNGLAQYSNLGADAFWQAILGGSLEDLPDATKYEKDDDDVPPISSVH